MKFNRLLLLVLIIIYVVFTSLYSFGLLDGFLLLAILIYSIGVIILLKEDDK